MSVSGKRVCSLKTKQPKKTRNILQCNHNVNKLHCFCLIVFHSDNTSSTNPLVSGRGGGSKLLEDALIQSLSTGGGTGVDTVDDVTSVITCSASFVAWYMRITSSRCAASSADSSISDDCQPVQDHHHLRHYVNTHSAIIWYWITNRSGLQRLLGQKVRKCVECIRKPPTS